MSIKKAFSILWYTIIISVFIGFMFSTAGAAIFPPVNQVAAPFVCLGQKLSVSSKTYHPSPGETDIVYTWTCQDGSAKGHEVEALQMMAFVIPIYTLIFFFPTLIVVILWTLVIAPGRKKKEDDDFQKALARNYPPNYDPDHLQQKRERPDTSQVHYNTALKSISLSGAQGENMDAINARFKTLLDSGRISQAQYDALLQKITELGSNPSMASLQTEILDLRNLASGPAADKDAQELRKLKSLLDSGLITSEDYEKKKAEILARM